MKFVVIGGDAAGMSAASRAKRNNPDMDVLVLEKTEDVSYSACGMPYNIADRDRAVEDLVVREAQVFRDKQGINLLTSHEVMAIDRDKKVVTGRTGEVTDFSFPYDKLLIATGGSPIYPDLPGVDLPGVFALKGLNDARKIKAFLEKKKNTKTVIIGMGYIGFEMCEALRQRSIDVDMVKPGLRVLPWMAEELSAVVQKEVQTQGVGLYPGIALEKINSKTDRLAVVGPDLELEADMVLVAIGIKPNSELAQEAGLDLSVQNAIAVDMGLKTSDESIYAAGDCADAYHVVTGKKTWIPLALRANRAGWAVADNVSGKAVALPGVAGTAVFKVFDLEVARTGIFEKEAEHFGFDPVSVVIKSRSRAHAHPGSTTLWVQLTGDKKSGRLLGAQMVGREGVAHRINAIAVALHNDMTAEQFGQADLAYAPPFGPVWDPLLTAANQLLKKLT